MISAYGEGGACRGRPRNRYIAARLAEEGCDIGTATLCGAATAFTVTASAPTACANVMELPRLSGSSPMCWDPAA
jgi:hypothetical protein